MAEALGFPLREEATLQTLTQDVVKTSEIEGEKLDAAQVRSSLARRMGMDIGEPGRRQIRANVAFRLDYGQSVSGRGYSGQLPPGRPQTASALR